MINPFRKQEAVTPMNFDKYQSVLSEKTRALMQLNQQKLIRESQEQRKRELISAIEECSRRVDGIDSDSELVQADIAKLERELSELESNLSKEEKAVYKQAQSILSDKTALAKEFNASINKAFDIWQQLSAELDQTEMLVFRTAYESGKPVDLGQTFDFDWGSVPMFYKHDNSNQIEACTRYQDRQPKL